MSPYIRKDDRYRLNLTIGGKIQNVGELTYLFAQLVNHYIKLKGLKYQTLAEIIGALEGCKLDVNNNILNAYEGTKALMNGEVYDPDMWDNLNKEYNTWSEENP